MRSLVFAVAVVIMTAAMAFGESQTSFIFGNGPQDSLALTDLRTVFKNRSLARAIVRANERGYTEVSESWGSRDYSDIQILIANKNIDNGYTRKYLATLANEKAKLMYYYQLTNREYNRLALIAFGVLGRETKFAMSPKYFLKEMAPAAVTLAKKVQAAGAGKKYAGTNSRGPTQIKRIPKLIEQHYQIKKSDLMSAENAAIATLGFLADCLRETKMRAQVRNLSYINETNIYDYLLYSYFGSARQLIAGTATPNKNLYIKTVKRHVGDLVLLELHSNLLVQ